MSCSKTFCMHPFTGLATREDGAIKVCCRSHPIGHIQDSSLEEIWNNDTIKRIRRQVLNNERPPECDPCFSLEDQGVETIRMRHIKGTIPEARINLYPNALDNLNDQRQRKLTSVLQLDGPEDYEGGTLELLPCGSIREIEKKKGYMVTFPSFVLHRVTPVESGIRRTLVAWFTGPDWR